MIAGDYIVDLKTSRRPQGKPLEEYRNQLQLYMKLYGKNKGLMGYITREGLKYFLEERDEGEKRKTRTESSETGRLTKRENRLPEAEVGPWRKWCTWATQELCPEGYNYKMTKNFE